MIAYLSIFAAQLLYTLSDVWKKWLFNRYGFSFATFLMPAFIGAMLVALIGFAFQMHALSKLDLSRVIISLTILAMVGSAMAGAIVFKDQMHWWNYVGICLAVFAVVLVNWK
jgi:drug/metabolite transporter (DMT)-like permease